MDANVTRKRLATAVVTAMDAAGRDVMEWGKDDCALFAANVIRDVLPYDPAADWRGRYRTRRGAARLLGRGGLLSAVQRMARRYKWKRIDPAMAQPGDVGLAWVEYDGKSVLATVICRATRWFVGRNEKGWTALRPEGIAACWSILDDCAPGARVSLRQINGQPVPKEPVSIGIGIATLFGATVSTAVAGIIGGVVLSAVSIGVSLISSLLQAHRGVGQLDSANLSDTSQAASVQVQERQSIPYKQVVVGKAFKSGAIFFEQVKPPYLTMGLLLNHGEIAGVDQVFIGTNLLGFSNGIVDGSIITPTGIDRQPDYPNRLKLSLRYGSATQTLDPLIAQDYTNVDAEFRQRGIATAVFRYHFGADQNEFISLWGQVSRPNPYLVVRGVVAYDPRDPLQSLDDETTWKWTNNATLVQAWYLTRTFGGRISKSRIRWDKIADAANYDDEVIGCGDGTLIKRHTIDGVITLSERPSDVMQKLLTANAGLLLESGGKVWLSSSRPLTPIATIHDAILSGAIKYQSAKAKRDLVNKLQVRAVAPNQDYQIVDGPILDRTDLQVVDGEVLPSTLTLDYTLDDSTNWTRVQRLQKLFLERARLGRTITCTVDLEILAIAADELVGNVVTFNSEIFSAANGTYQVTAVGLADDVSSVSLALTEYDASIEDNWNPEVDEQAFTLADINTA